MWFHHHFCFLRTTLDLWIYPWISFLYLTQAWRGFYFELQLYFVGWHFVWWFCSYLYVVTLMVWTLPSIWPSQDPLFTFRLPRISFLYLLQARKGPMEVGQFGLDECCIEGTLFVIIKLWIKTQTIYIYIYIYICVSAQHII